MNLILKIKQAATRFDQKAIALAPSMWPMVKAVSTRLDPIAVAERPAKFLSPVLQAGQPMAYRSVRSSLDALPLVSRASDQVKHVTSKYISKYLGTITFASSLYAIYQGEHDILGKLAKVEAFGLLDGMKESAKFFAYKSLELNVFSGMEQTLRNDIIGTYAPGMVIPVMAVAAMSIPFAMLSAAKFRNYDSFEKRKDKLTDKILPLEMMHLAGSLSATEIKRLDRLKSIFEKKYKSDLNPSETQALRQTLAQDQSLDRFTATLSLETNEAIGEIITKLGDIAVPAQIRQKAAMEMISDRNGNIKHLLHDLKNYRIEPQWIQKYGIKEEFAMDYKGYRPLLRP